MAISPCVHTPAVMDPKPQIHQIEPTRIRHYSDPLGSYREEPTVARRAVT